MLLPYPPTRPEPSTPRDDGVTPLPQIQTHILDKEGFSWSTMGTNFTFRLLAMAEEIGYTIDASQAIPEGFHVGKQIRLQFRGSSEVHTTTLVDIKLRFSRALISTVGVELWVAPEVGGKLFIDAKDIDILDD